MEYTSSPRAVLLDVGGVLTVDPWETLLLAPGVGIADRVGVDQVTAAHVGQDLWETYARAAADEDAYWLDLSQRLEVTIPAALVRETELALLQALPGAIAALDALDRAGTPWGLITNNTSFWYPKQVALLGLGPGGPRWEFVSSAAHVTKSDPVGLFEVAASTLDAADFLVVDDREPNVERALRAGFNATLCRPGEVLSVLSEEVNL